MRQEDARSVSTAPRTGRRGTAPRGQTRGSSPDRAARSARRARSRWLPRRTRTSLRRGHGRPEQGFQRRPGGHQVEPVAPRAEPDQGVDEHAGEDAYGVAVALYGLRVARDVVVPGPPTAAFTRGHLCAPEYAGSEDHSLLGAPADARSPSLPPHPEPLFRSPHLVHLPAGA
jgi:hypothetical protein